MFAKISNLSELQPLVMNEEKISEGVLTLISRFNINRLLKPLSGFKKNGIILKTILVALILSRFRGLSVYAMCKSGLIQMDENTTYRMMNHRLMNWRWLLRAMAMQFLKIVASEGSDNKSVRCFVIDDTVIAKTGFTIEGVSKVFDHTTGSLVLGFKMLNLALWDGKSLFSIDFSLHRESKKKNWGLNTKQTKKQFSKKRAENTPSKERYDELDMEKPCVVIEMLHRACRHGILASYVLMDSWFTTDTIIHGIRKIRKGMMHVVGMCKMDRRFVVDDCEMKTDVIIKKKSICKGGIKRCRKYKSEYITVKACYKGTPVKLFFINYHRSKGWKLLLTTDLSLSFLKVMELYHIRWSIEVLYRECKQYLRLGQAQNTDFDGQIADAAITLITHLILSLQLRFQVYETMGGLWRGVQGQIIQDDICKRIMNIILEIIEQLLEIFSIDIDDTIEKLLGDDKQAKEVINLLWLVKEKHPTEAKIKIVK